MKSFLGNFYRHLTILYWSHWLWQRKKDCFLMSKRDSLELSSKMGLKPSCGSVPNSILNFFHSLNDLAFLWLGKRSHRTSRPTTKLLRGDYICIIKRERERERGKFCVLMKERERERERVREATVYWYIHLWFICQQKVFFSLLKKLFSHEINGTNSLFHIKKQNIFVTVITCAVMRYLSEFLRLCSLERENICVIMRGVCVGRCVRVRGRERVRGNGY